VEGDVIAVGIEESSKVARERGGGGHG